MNDTQQGIVIACFIITGTIIALWLLFVIAMIILGLINRYAENAPQRGRNRHRAKLGLPPAGRPERNFDSGIEIPLMGYHAHHVDPCLPSLKPIDHD